MCTVWGPNPSIEPCELDPGAPDGYLREWQPPGLAPLRHLSYAIQWWCFAALAVVVWAVFGVRRARAASGLR